MKARAIRRVSALLVTVALGLALAPQAAHAAYAMPGTYMSIVKSACTRSNPHYWWGMTQDLTVLHPEYAPRGTVYFCMEKYRVSDSDPNFDYYAIAISSYWTRTSGDNWYPAVMNQSVYSNWAAREDVYDATPTYTSNKSCSSAFEVGLSIRWFSIAVSPEICSGETVSRISVTPRGAAWSAPRVGKVNVIETSYAQMIPNGGSVPKFDVQFKVPQYIANFNGLVWDYTPAWQNVTYAGW